MELQSLTRPEVIWPDLADADAKGVLREVSDRLAAQGLVRSGDELFRKLWEREQLSSTAVGRGVAIPHCKLDGLDQVILAVGICPCGVPFGAADEQPVKVFFLVVSPTDAPANHLQSLAAISRWVKVDHHVDALLERRDPEEIYELLGADPD